MIKEVEFRFSPSFEKAINEVKTKRKTQPAAKPKARPAAKSTTPKPPRGYKIEKVIRPLTLNGRTDMYELYELTGTKLPAAKLFVSYEYALEHIKTFEAELLRQKALAGKVHGGPMARGVIAEQSELMAQSELPELETGIERPAKVAIEDVDA